MRSVVLRIGYIRRYKGRSDYLGVYRGIGAILEFTSSAIQVYCACGDLTSDLCREQSSHAVGCLVPKP